MNKNELLDVLMRIDESNENIILLDGKWGSGKTYLLNEFIKSYKKVPIYYISLLGKRTVDDINTALFVEVNKDIKLTSIVPIAVSPFNHPSSLDFVLKLKSKCNGIVILDDLERYASSNYDEFLSYVLSLTLKGVKIICVSNLLALGAGERYNFEQYKEKIFDHYYRCDLFTNDLLKSKLDKYYSFFDDELIKEFNENIRIIEKTGTFLSLINFQLFNQLDKKIQKSFIFYLITVLRVLFNETNQMYSKLEIKAEFKEKEYIFKHFHDEESKWECLKCYEYALNINSIYRLINKIDNKEESIDLIIALYNLYIFNDSKLLNNFLYNNINKRG